MLFRSFLAADSFTVIVVPTGTPVNFMFLFAFKWNVYVPPSASVTSPPLALIPPSVFASVPFGNAKVAVKANKNMKITGVPVGTTITVKESAAKNYKGSAEITINGTKLTSVAETSYNTELTAVRSQKLGQKQNIVDVTNTYNDVPVTGIIMNTLPYVLMIALCGVALIAFVGFKRRRLQK